MLQHHGSGSLGFRVYCASQVVCWGLVVPSIRKQCTSYCPKQHRGNPSEIGDPTSSNGFSGFLLGDLTILFTMDPQYGNLNKNT